MLQEAFSKKLSEKDKKAKEQVAAVEKKYQQREIDTKKQITSLEKKIKELNASGGGGGARAAGGGKGGKVIFCDIIRNSLCVFDSMKVINKK